MKKIIIVFVNISKYFLNILLIISCIFVLLWIFEPIRIFLLNTKLFDDSSYISVVTAAILGAGGILWTIQVKINRIDEIIERSVANAMNSKDTIIQNGIEDVYPFVKKIMLQTQHKNKNKKDKLVISALTLYTAWPQLKSWLTHNDLKNWDIYLFVINPSFIENNNDVFISNWSELAHGMINDISEFLKNSTLITAKKININLFLYNTIPSIHGFKINDDIFISYLQRDDNGKIDSPHYFYEFISGNDKNTRADHYKLYFNNWIEYLFKYCKKNTGTRYESGSNFFE